jgi:hypothetical protein
VIEEVHANKNEDIIYLNIIKNQQKRTSWSYYFSMLTMYDKIMYRVHYRVNSFQFIRN